MIPEIAMDYSKKTKEELIVMCREQKKKGYSGKKRDDLIQLLESNQNTVIVPSVAPISVAPISVAQETVNQPSSKLRMIDLFAGTGAFTNAFQQTGKVACVFANDMVEWSKRIYDENYDHKLTLQDLNTVKVEDIPPHDILTGGFPCFVAGTLVLTNTGYKKIEDVTTTDTLLTHTGAFQSIRNLQRKFGVEEVHAIDIANHSRVIQCTSEHPFYVKERVGNQFSERKWTTAKDLTSNHYAGMILSHYQDHTNPDEIVGDEILHENDYVWIKVKSNTMKRVEPQTVYNFEVENDNSYCVENTIVHNCQPFSIAGKQEGFDDARSNVFWKILEIIDRHQPRAVVLENVKNLVNHDDGKTFQTIKQNLTDRGYNIQTKILNTSDITGIPQHRERIYIVCLKDKHVADQFTLDFPKIEKSAVSSMLTTEPVPPKYYYTDASATWPLVSESVVKTDTIYQYRRVYVRENKSNECPTLTANMGGGGHNVPLIRDAHGIRKLTPRECFNFQGFPASYRLPNISDTNLYKLAGNAVSVPVVRLIANRLIPLLCV